MRLRTPRGDASTFRTHDGRIWSEIKAIRPNPPEIDEERTADVQILTVPTGDVKNGEPVTVRIAANRARKRAAGWRGQMFGEHYDPNPKPRAHRPVPTNTRTGTLDRLAKRAERVGISL